jgi:MFS family permease
MYYAPRIFQQAGVEGNSASLIASGVNGVLKVLATIPAVLYIDRLGRRVVMITGAAIMGTAMILCGAVMGGTGEITTDANGDSTIYMGNNKSASYFAIVCIYFFVAGFAFSWGPVGWVYPAEIYPLSVRSKGTSLTTAANWLMNFVISEIVPIMIVKITWGTYIFFGCCCAVMATVVYFFYPETKGKSLEEMEVVFTGSIFAHKQKYIDSASHAELSVHEDEKKAAL